LNQLERHLCHVAISHGNVASRISRSRFVCTNRDSIFDADVNAAKTPRWAILMCVTAVLGAGP
jgi:transposase